MFTNKKRDYYSVNAEIHLAPLTDDQILRKMMINEQNNTHKAVNNLQE